MNPQLQHHSALYAQSALFGLPVPIFALALVVSSFGIGLFISGLGVVLGGIFGALMTVLVFRPLQAIHKHDLLAWRLWIRTLQVSHFTAHIVKKKTVFVQTQHRIVTFQQWSHFK
ncbi:hypothetical protein L4D18_21795 [Vibrio campbellii]|uniref:hypothetical protein n=1 Tax=Vibrio campbellii TaxID=680 RepID=UPI003D101771